MPNTTLFGNSFPDCRNSGEDRSRWPSFFISYAFSLKGRLFQFLGGRLKQNNRSLKHQESVELQITFVISLKQVVFTNYATPYLCIKKCNPYSVRKTLKCSRNTLPTTSSEQWFGTTMYSRAGFH